MEWLDGNQIKIDPPKRPKKITGTRLAAILGLNKWTTPFEVWCEITRTYEKPFEDTKYTLAGKAIEPKQAYYMKNEYLMDNLVYPEQVFGKDYFNKTRGDFFPNSKIFGGMWDYLNTYDDNNTVYQVLEMKTSSRPEDWINGVPEHYAIQAALYAYLLGCDNVVMVASFLEPEDYDHPEDFFCTEKNTSVIDFKVSEMFPDFEELLTKAESWWKHYVEGGISPEFDEKKDAEILKALRTKTLNPNTDIEEILEEADSLITDIEKAEEKLKDKKDRLNEIKDIVKEYSVSKFKDGDKYVELSSDKYKFKTSKSITKTIDKKKMEDDGILETYQLTQEGYKLSISALR